MKIQMKKQLIIAATFSAMLSMSAFAGSWQSDANGWWYDNGNGTWPASQWEWIDGNNDGVAECYYFDQNGYCLMNTTTPDGYAVDASGAWIIDGQVQTKQVTKAEAYSNSQSNYTEGIDLLTVQPSAKRYCYTFENLRTNRNDLWSKGFRLDIYMGSWDRGGAYAEYCANGEYSQLVFTMAPAEKWAVKDLEAVVEVYGDNDSLLYSSDDVITYKTKEQTIKVDITGQEYVKIYVDATEHWPLLGGDPSTYLMFKNVRFL